MARITPAELEEMVGRLVETKIASLKSSEAGEAEPSQEAGTELAELRERVGHLESEDHNTEVIAAWLQDLDGADPETKIALGVKLGLDSLFAAAETVPTPQEVPGVQEPPPVVAEPNFGEPDGPKRLRKFPYLNLLGREA